MELSEAIEYARDPGKIIEPGTCNMASSVIGGWLRELEEAEFEARLALDTLEDVLFAEIGVNATVARKMRLTQEYREWQRIRRELAQHKRLRRTLNERFMVLTQTKHY